MHARCPDPRHPRISGDVSSDGCTVIADRYHEYCFSGEGQCEHLSVTFTIAADGHTASGSGKYCRCWDPGYQCSDRLIQPANAVRE